MEKIIEMILKSLVILGFVAILGGVGWAGRPELGAFVAGMTTALIGFCASALIILGASLYKNYRSSLLPKWERKKRRRLGLTG